MELKNKLARARYTLLKDDFCFFGILAFHLEYKIEEGVETASTNGREIIFGKEYLENLKDSHVTWVIAHEIMHVAYKHLSRRNSRNTYVWNLACDYAVNSILFDFESNSSSKVSFEKPKDSIYESRFTNKSAEEIYNILMEENILDSKNLIEIKNHDMWDEYDESQDCDEVEWKKRIISSAKQAGSKDRGTLPNYLQDIIASLNPPKKDWRTILSEFVEPENVDYSFNPPDKRYSSYSFFLPDFNEEDNTVKNIVFFIDISGSMSVDDISNVYSEVVGAISQFGNMSGYLGYFDTVVHSFKKFEDITDVLENKPKSGGGTIFEVCFKYIKDKMSCNELENVSSIILLTDGYCPYENSEEYANGIPTLFVMTSKDIPEAPFGKTIYLEDN